MTVITRFAPSPTGNLHVGGLRTALFNFLYAKRHGGKFFLRIEDTDTVRSDSVYLDSILHGLQWLSLTHDRIVYQSANVARHREVALALLESGKAYIEDGAIRLRVGRKEMVKFSDLILGEISIDSENINDVVLLRSDGMPTYMLAVVVDDHDMGVTHVVRGSDHITNTFTQKLIYEGMGWSFPEVAHIPLIHNLRGGKLSKRDGAVDALEYKDAGILPEAMLNYLLRLGWSHGDKEIFSMQEAIDLFDVSCVGKSPSCFDCDKLSSLNSHYMQKLPVERIVAEISNFIECDLMVASDTFSSLVELFRKRCSSLITLRDSLQFCWSSTVPSEVNGALLREVSEFLEHANWNLDLQDVLKEYISRTTFSAKEVYTNLRRVLTGQENSPSIVEIMRIFGKEMVLGKLRHFLG